MCQIMIMSYILHLIINMILMKNMLWRNMPKIMTTCDSDDNNNVGSLVTLFYDHFGYFLALTQSKPPV